VIVAAQGPRAPPQRLGVQFDQAAERRRLAVLRAAHQIGFVG